MPFAKHTNPLGDIICGFVRAGPRRTEVYYRTAGALMATQVDMRGATPLFGEHRVLANFPFPQTLGPGEGSGVAASHVWGNYNNVARMLTVPQDGNGVGSEQHLFNATGEMNYSCANTISPDGSMAAQNPGENNDGSGCIPIAGPGWSLNSNHKGFVVLPFLESAEPSVSWLDMYRQKALSVNWCPNRFRYGAYNESGFVRWYFGNNDEYLIGARNAGQEGVFGAWVVHWPSNTWTLVTPEGTQVDEPAVFFAGSTRSREARLIPGRTLAGKHSWVVGLNGTRTAISGQCSLNRLPPGLYFGAGRFPAARRTVAIPFSATW